MEKGKRCTHCGAEFISEKDGQRMIDVARKMGIWGEPLRLYRKLTKSSRGITLRIPADLQRALHLTGKENVAFTKAGNRIYVGIEPADA